MTNYSNTPGHVKCIRFKMGGKWYDEWVLDMSEFYNEGITPIDAAEAALRAAGHNIDSPTNTWEYVVPDPYHKGAYPVIVRGKGFHELLAKAEELRNGDEDA